MSCFVLCQDGNFHFNILFTSSIQVHDGSFTPTSQFIKDPDSLCSTISWRDEEDRVIWVYKIQVNRDSERWWGH